MSSQAPLWLSTGLQLDTVFIVGVCWVHPAWEKSRSSKFTLQGAQLNPSKLIVVAQDFCCSKSRIRPFFGSPAKSGSGQISSRICQIWQVPVQLRYIQLITDKTNGADLSILNPLPFHKFCKKTGEQ